MIEYIVRDEHGVGIAKIGEYQYKQILDEADIEFGVITLKNIGKVNVVKIMSDCTIMFGSNNSKIAVFLWKDYYIYKV